MTVTIRVAIIFLACVSCVHLRKLCSSYFAISYLKQARHGDSDKIAEFNADSQLTCALRCSTKGSCDEATFYKDSKKCSLYQKKDQGSTEPYVGDDNTRSRIVTMRKVRNVLTTVFIGRCSVTALNCFMGKGPRKDLREALISNISYTF